MAAPDAPAAPAASDENAALLNNGQYPDGIAITWRHILLGICCVGLLAGALGGGIVFLLLKDEVAQEVVHEVAIAGIQGVVHDAAHSTPSSSSASALRTTFTTTVIGLSFRHVDDEAAWPADGSEKHCRPKGGTGVHLRVRKDIHSLSDEDFAKFKDAVNKVKSSGKYDELVRLHERAHQAHGHDEFLPFHRKYVDIFETELQVAANDCNLTLPFWNWGEETGALTKSTVWSDTRYGRLSVGCVKTGVAAGWKLSSGRCLSRQPAQSADGVLISFKNLLELTVEDERYETMRELLEANHGALHCVVGGVMCSYSSPADPLFWLHHGFIDKIWWLWQKTHRTTTPTCGNCNQLSDFEHVNAEEYVGRWDEERSCVLYPMENPTRCLAYSKLGSSSHIGDRRLKTDASNGEQAKEEMLGEKHSDADDRTYDSCFDLNKQLDNCECTVKDMKGIKNIQECMQNFDEYERLSKRWFSKMLEAGHEGTDGKDMHGGLLGFAQHMLDTTRKKLNETAMRPAHGQAELDTCMACDQQCLREYER